uniref:Secreted protein n=1 Tax=Oryza sativa subsp. japonica TaxID=39947 RepID=Q6H5C0_ORYSJ|nr:hypothetical protein [Oryza sativa Japonica Group]
MVGPTRQSHISSLSLFIFFLRRWLALLACRRASSGSIFSDYWLASCLSMTPKNKKHPNSKASSERLILPRRLLQSAVALC